MLYLPRKSNSSVADAFASAPASGPVMVDRKAAARLCSMSPATYTKYAQKGLLPQMNATGRVSLEALRLACLRLDGIAETTAVDDPLDRELAEFRGRHGYA